MNKSESIKELAAALAKAQAEIENASKNSANGAYKGTKYADLAEVLNTVRPVMASHGISIVQMPSYDNGVVFVETVMMHNSGEWISNTASSPVTKHDAQGVGSCITYLRRYSMASFCGIAQEDDDANAAVGKKIQGSQPENNPHSLPEVIGPVEFKALQDALDETKSDKVAFCEYFGVKSLAELPKQNFAAAMAMLNKKRAAP